ncbi:hypothetical protein DFJ63DRAFT_170288 [Scheffersomyces coipomensis]|uniref:uncharacterized protein n=1 Tax=Scheffersomyces coipomensis TaxID=1788519 RepID=UPI00315D1703
MTLLNHLSVRRLIIELVMKIQILSYLSIEDIVLFKSLINDVEIEDVPIKDITKERLRIEYMRDHDELIHSEELDLEFGSNEEKMAMKLLKMHFHHIEQSQLKLQKLIKLNKVCQDIIPIHIDSVNAHHIPLKFLNGFSGESQKFDLILEVENLSHKSISDLDEFSYPDIISGIIITSVPTSDFSTDFNIDFESKMYDLSRYKNLRLLNVPSFSTYSSIFSPNLFNTLTDLIINNICEFEYLSHFNKLERLEVEINAEEEFYIKDLPRRISKLKLIVDVDVDPVIINSSDDWPPNLKSLSLKDDYCDEPPFVNFQNYDLPSNLTSLDVEGHFLDGLLDKSPVSLTELTLSQESYYDNSQLINFKIPHGITKLDLTEFNSSNNSLDLPSGLQSFKLFNCNFSMPVNDFNFDHCKSSLRVFEVESYKNPISFTNLDFSEFSKLTNISIADCAITSLSSFNPPTCLRYLDIIDNSIKTLDESCPLFNNPSKYSQFVEATFKDCQITRISPNIKWPIHLQDLFISDSCEKKFFFTSSIARHKSLRKLHLGVLSSIHIYDLNITKSGDPSKFEKLTFTFTSDSIPKTKQDYNRFYDKIEFHVGKKIQKRAYKTNLNKDVVMKFVDTK